MFIGGDLLTRTQGFDQALEYDIAAVAGLRGSTPTEDDEGLSDKLFLPRARVHGDDLRRELRDRADGFLEAQYLRGAEGSPEGFGDVIHFHLLPRMVWTVASKDL
jgi:hypothetical protein